jgi:hypothetical protein
MYKALDISGKEISGCLIRCYDGDFIVKEGLYKHDISREMVSIRPETIELIYKDEGHLYDNSK